MKNIVTIHTPEHVQIPYDTAGVGTRSLAKLIDLICLSIVMIPFSMIVSLFSAIFYDTNEELPSIFTAILIFVLSAVPLAYFVCLEYWMNGQTFGKRIMRIRVIQDQGGNPSFFSIFLRNLLQLADLLPGFYVIGMIAIFFHHQDKRLGDMVAGTLVIKEQQGKSKEMYFQHATLSLSPAEMDIFKRLQPLSGEKFIVLESFLLRRNEMDPQIRQQLAEKFITSMWPEIQAHTGYEESFLEKVYLYLRQTSYPAHFPKIVPNFSVAKISN